MERYVSAFLFLRWFSESVRRTGGDPIDEIVQRLQEDRLVRRVLEPRVGERESVQAGRHTETTAGGLAERAVQSRSATMYVV